MKIFAYSSVTFLSQKKVRFSNQFQIGINWKTINYCTDVTPYIKKEKTTTERTDFLDEIYHFDGEYIGAYSSTDVAERDYYEDEFIKWA